MRLNHPQQPDLFERRPDRSPIPCERREVMLEILRTLLTKAVSAETSTPIRKEARHEPDRG